MEKVPSLCVRDSAPGVTDRGLEVPGSWLRSRVVPSKPHLKWQGGRLVCSGGWTSSSSGLAAGLFASGRAGVVVSLSQ